MVKGVKWLKHCGGEGRFSLGCCLTCFAALLLYLFFVHLPLQEACASYEGRRAELRGRLAAVMNFKNVHGDMAAYAKELSDREVRAQRVLPMSLGQGVFLQELQQKALQSQVKLQKVVPAETRIEQHTEAQSEVGALQCQLVVTAYAWPQGGAQDGMEGEDGMSRE